jgi:hypothetical protein
MRLLNLIDKDKFQSRRKPEITMYYTTTIIFTVLKLAEVIDWSWWWVLGPLWIPAAITGALVVIGFIIVSLSDKENPNE